MAAAQPEPGLGHHADIPERSVGKRQTQKEGSRAGCAPLLHPLEAVADDDHVGQRGRGPVPPEQVVVQRLPAVHHVEQRGRIPHPVLALLWGAGRWCRAGAAPGAGTRLGRGCPHLVLRQQPQPQLAQRRHLQLREGRVEHQAAVRGHLRGHGWGQG